jgi:hypothetical protein
LLQNKKWFYLPVQLSFINDGTDFDKMVISMVEDNLQKLSSLKNAKPSS